MPGELLTPNGRFGNQYNNKEIGTMAKHNTILNHFTTLFRSMDSNDLPPLIVGNRNSGHATVGVREKKPFPDGTYLLILLHEDPSPDILFHFYKGGFPAAEGTKPFTKSTRIEFLAKFYPGDDQNKLPKNATEQAVLILLQRSNWFISYNILYLFSY